MPSYLYTCIRSVDYFVADRNTKQRNLVVCNVSMFYLLNSYAVSHVDNTNIYHSRQISCSSLSYVSYEMKRDTWYTGQCVSFNSCNCIARAQPVQSSYFHAR